MRENKYTFEHGERKQSIGRKMCEPICHVNWQSEVVLLKLGIWNLK